MPLKDKFFKNFLGAQFASTDCPFRMSGAGSSIEAVWVSGRIFYLFSGIRSRIFLPFISRRKELCNNRFRHASA